MDTIQRLGAILTEATESGPDAFAKKWMERDPRFTKYESKALQQLLNGFVDGKLKLGDVKGTLEMSPQDEGATERIVSTIYSFQEGRTSVEAAFDWSGGGEEDSVGFDVTVSQGGKVVDRAGEIVDFPAGKEPGAKFMSVFSKVYKKMAMRFISR